MNTEPSRRTGKNEVSHGDPPRNTVKGVDQSKGCPYQMYRWQFTLGSMVEPMEPKFGAGHSQMTLNAFASEVKELANNLSKFCKEWYMQLEMGETTGYIHYQGCLSLKNKEYMQTVKNLLGRNDAHIERANNWSALKAYCTKKDTRVAGPWSHETVWLNVIEKLYPWQQEVVDLVTGPCIDDRSIHWFYDRVGNKGKTQLCKMLFAQYGATVVNNGAFSDLAYVLPEQPKIVCFCLPRTIEGKVNYSAIEAIKDGLIFSGKYESKTKVFDSPHVIVMANFRPNIASLSLDRWQIHEMDTVDCGPGGSTCLSYPLTPITTLDGIEPLDGAM